MRSNPDVFELCVQRQRGERDLVRALEWRSRQYGLEQSIQIRPTWCMGNREAIERLCRFIEELVGDTLRSFDRLQVRAGREMAQALMPHFEREIYLCMDRIEHGGWHLGRVDNFRYVETRQRDEEARSRVRGSLHRHQAMAMDFIEGQSFDAMVFDDWGAAGFFPKTDKKAEEKARQLLMRHLDAGQLKQFKKEKAFRVTAKGGEVYTITHEHSFNVKKADGTRYCGQTVNTPLYDQMLAQKMLLEHEPEKFLAAANVSRTGTAGMDLAMRAAGSRVEAMQQMADLVNAGPMLINHEAVVRRMYGDWMAITPTPPPAGVPDYEALARRAREDLTRPGLLNEAVAPEPEPEPEPPSLLTPAAGPTVRIRRPNRFRVRGEDDGWMA